MFWLSLDKFAFVKMSLLIKYSLVLSILIAHLGLPGYVSIDQFEIFFQNIVILTSLVNMIFSFDVKQNFDNIANV